MTHDGSFTLYFIMKSGRGAVAPHGERLVANNYDSEVAGRQWAEDAKIEPCLLPTTIIAKHWSDGRSCPAHTAAAVGLWRPCPRSAVPRAACGVACAQPLTSLTPLS